MDKIHQALERFRNPYSCAQTIWAAYGGGDDRLDEMKANSGGRAPDNMCGALYAALQILPEGKRRETEENFAKLAGSTKCLEIKTKFKTLPRLRKIRGNFAREITQRNSIRRRHFVAAFFVH